jgi:hypothetical protein
MFQKGQKVIVSIDMGKMRRLFTGTVEEVDGSLLKLKGVQIDGEGPGGTIVFNMNSSAISHVVIV